MRHRGAFTLIEVLLAALIMAVAMTLLLTAASRCMAVMKVAKNYQSSQWVLGKAESEHPMMISNDVSELEVGREEFEGGFTYSRIVEDDDDEDGLYVVKARVTWSDRGGESFDEVVSCVYWPEKDSQ